ncbi:hypothetical protein KO507_13615 [Gilvimarinus agarilyticus]|uniref:hypothetical protein n=1 Tax=unclassified Gilvimarinus TaxID=2642066 RepID=UPI001C09FBAE|nr:MULTISPECIES: hypothetical protein [unclassified Gilvimarinus]MBU2886805.1 hypothetical protein [Gilvimarinus agarilyticus]MDO6571469.1 hypothetical protein [Gilvimarinus sp. 2_MG-2023]MDO6747350.1 hypothetical protein [Gilvimarinus sp. 1_MG-2023]
MPQLYHSIVDVPPPSPHFRSQTLHLTQVLLREHQPHLSAHLGDLLNSLKAVNASEPNSPQGSIAAASLLNSLGAVTIGKIISALTDIGNVWLAAPNDKSESLHGLHNILQQWIELGEWLVLQTSDG